MPGLTVTEKEHWKERIAKRIDKKIETVLAAEPNLIERVQREARERALESLGLADLNRQREAQAQQREAADKQEKRITKSILAHLRGVPVEDVEDIYYQQDAEIDRTIQRRQVVHEEELLAENETGKRILLLREEKDNLLDTVWLATSPTQLKQLWTKVAELLGDTPTQLERDALAIVPVEE